jgi:hypothetical protein
MEDFAQGYFLSILQLPLLEHCANYAQLFAWLQRGLQILTCSSQIWLKSSYSHSGFSMLQKFLTQYNFGNCLNTKNKNSQWHLILADTSSQLLPEI